MAVGRGPKLTMPILARINFFHKYDPNLFSILNLKWSKKNWSAHIWPVGSHAFDQNGPPHGALITWAGKFFLKRYPLWIWILYMKMFLKVKIGQILADWPTPPLVQNGPHCRAPNTRVGNFFHKTDPLWIWILWKIKLNNLQMGSLLADWQTPHFSKRPQKWDPKYMNWQFFHKTDPLLILILCRKLFINFKIGQFWADWQTPPPPMCPKRPKIWGPKYKSWHFFH